MEFRNTRLKPTPTSRVNLTGERNDGYDGGVQHRNFHATTHNDPPERIQRYHSSADIKLSTSSRKEKPAGLARSHTRTDLSDAKRGPPPVSNKPSGAFVRGGGREWKGMKQADEYSPSGKNQSTLEQFHSKGVGGDSPRMVKKQTSTSTPLLSRRGDLVGNSTDFNESTGRTLLGQKEQPISIRKNIYQREDSFDQQKSYRSVDRQASIDSPMSSRRTVSTPQRSSPISQDGENSRRSFNVIATNPESPILRPLHRSTPPHEKVVGREDDELSRRFQQMQRKQLNDVVGGGGGGGGGGCGGGGGGAGGGGEERRGSRDSIGSAGSAGRLETIPVKKYQKIETSDYFNYKKVSDIGNSGGKERSSSPHHGGKLPADLYEPRGKSTTRGQSRNQVTYIPYAGSEENLHMNMNPFSGFNARSSSSNEKELNQPVSSRARGTVFK